MLKTLYLIRHAKSSWENPSLKDHDRPLNKRGIGDIPEMGKRMLKRDECPDQFISSTALRTKLTAEGIAEEIGYPLDKIKYSNKLFHASAETILGIITKSPSEIKSIALFAHNPGITMLANQLSNTHIDNVPTCGILKFQINIQGWFIDVSTSEIQLDYFDYPKKKI